MENVVVGSSPEITEQVKRALDTLKKSRYEATVHDGEAGGDHAITFKLGATEQTIKFTDAEWTESGAVERKIIDKLEI